MDHGGPIAAGPSINYVSSNSSQALNIKSSMDIAAEAGTNLASGAVAQTGLVLSMRLRSPGLSEGRDVPEHGAGVVECDREGREDAEGDGRGDAGIRRASARAARAVAADIE